MLHLVLIALIRLRIVIDLLWLDLIETLSLMNIQFIETALVGDFLSNLTLKCCSLWINVHLLSLVKVTSLSSLIWIHLSHRVCI